MTSQLLMSHPSSTLSRPQSATSSSQNGSSVSSMPAHFVRSLESMKLVYQADQQVKFLHLQAEVESLLLQLQTIKQQRLATTSQLSNACGINNDSN